MSERPARASSAREATVGVKALRATCAAARFAALDLDALLTAHGIPTSALQDPDHRFAYTSWVALWREIEQRSGDAGIGLHTAARLPHGHWDVIDYLATSSDTLGAAFARFERYFPLISTAVEHRLRRSNGDARLVRHYRPGVVRCRPAAELALTSIVLRFGAVACTPWKPREVLFSHTPSVSLAEYEELFGCPVRFGAKDDAIVLAPDLLDLQLQRPEPELCAVLERHAQAQMTTLSTAAASVEERVMAAVMAELSRGVPSVSVAAKRLGMSGRTLQRRLQESGAAYSDMVERARDRLSRAYLADPQIGLAEVGYLLGFSDPSAFYRAFRRWSGETPGAYRARLRAETK